MKRRFDFGDAFSTVFSVFASGFGTWVSVSAVFWIPIMFLALCLWAAGVPLEYATPLAQDFDPGQNSSIDTYLTETSLALIASLMLIQLHAILTTAATVHGVFRTMRHERPSIADCVRSVFPRMGWLIALSFLQTLAIGCGYVLCCIPGAMINTIWYVAIPCFMTEKVGISESLQRSSFLTLGYRWPVFGIMILLILINVVVSGLGTVFQEIGDSIGWIFFVLNLIAGPILISIGPAVVYHDLREDKEGLDEQELEDVFG